MTNNLPKEGSFSLVRVYTLFVKYGLQPYRECLSKLKVWWHDVTLFVILFYLAHLFTYSSRLNR
jgi:hypothetical protein